MRVFLDSLYVFYFLFFWSLGLFLFILFSLKTLSPQTWIITISFSFSFSSAGIVALRRVPAVRYTEARHSSMRTSLSSAGVSWRTLMWYPSYAHNRACTLPSPSPFHYVMAKIVPVVQLGRTVVRSPFKFFRLDELLLFCVIMRLRCAANPAIIMLIYSYG